MQKFQNLVLSAVLFFALAVPTNATAETATYLLVVTYAYKVRPADDTERRINQTIGNFDTESQCKTAAKSVGLELRAVNKRHSRFPGNEVGEIIFFRRAVCYEVGS